MTFKTQINRLTSKHEWYAANGNTKVSDGYVASESNFGNRASAKTIAREYLKTYGLEPDDSGTYGGTFDVQIHRRPGHPDANECFTVRVHPDGKWATVTA